MKIRTDLDTLSEAWIILEDLNLTSVLIPGNKTETDALELARKLLKEKKLHMFVATVTGSSIEETGKLSLAEAVEYISDFFTTMASELVSLADIWTVLKEESPSQ